MKLVNFVCPGCGAQLSVDAGLKQATCQFCGSTFPIDDEAQHVKFDGAEQAGYEFEKGRQRAQQEHAAPQTVYVQVEAQPQKPKRKTWLWVLGWICIFPVPLTIIMLKNEAVKEKLNPKARYAIIAVAWLLYLIIGLSGGGSSSDSSKAAEEPSVPAATQTVESSASATSSAAAVTEKTIEPVELDELQEAFCALNSSMTRDDIDALIAERGFAVTKLGVHKDSSYYIGYEYQAVAERGRDREGEALDVNFDDSGVVKSAEYTVHTGFDTHTALTYESGSFFYEGNRADSAESAMQQYIATLPAQSTRAATATNASNGIELIAGEKGEYGQELVMSEGTDMQEDLIVYYVPAGSYTVKNLGDKPTQVSVYAGVQKGDGGYDEYTETGDIALIGAGEIGEITVPEGWFIEIDEPSHIGLTPKA